jgi:hypothetical protein
MFWRRTSATAFRNHAAEASMAQAKRPAAQKPLLLKQPRFTAGACAEHLEDRRLLSGARALVQPSYVWVQPHRHAPPSTFAAEASVTPSGESAPSGLTPAQVRHAYGLDQISFGNIVGDGTGQTIAIVVAYDQPGFVSSSDANFAASDLHQFDQRFGISDPPSFTKIDQRGGTNFPSPDSGWANETSMDVEWIHAMAPAANLVLVEADSNFNFDMWDAVDTARRFPGVSVVSMSWGTPETSSSFNTDSVFTTLPNHGGQTFLGATGDSGAPGQDPATSARVVAVGGTELTLGSGSTYGSEFGWSGSGGGIASFERKPSYQSSVTHSSTRRTIPDVSFASLGDSGFSVLNSYGNGSSPWLNIGGTSFSVLGWSAMISIVNQGRTLAGAGTLNGATQTLPGIYSLPSSDFHDITNGNNGFAASAGYDLVTGRGTPIVASLVPDLVNYSRGQIAGNVFQDTSSDGIQNTNEASTVNQTVFIDTDGDNTLDSGEVNVKTDAWGNYAFDNLAAGTYAIVANAPAGYAVTGAGARQSITLAQGANRAGVNFGFVVSQTGSISGTVYNDANGDRAKQSGEAGIGGITVYNDANNNSKLDAGEITTVTDSSGVYVLSGLGTGSFKVREILQSGWSQTTPTNNYGWTITLAANQHVVGKDFGTRSSTPPITGSLSGFTFNDNNVNGAFDAGDAKTSGKTVFLDLNGNDKLDSGEKSVVTDTNGNYTFTGLSAGTYHVRRVFPSGYTYSTAPIDVALASGQSIGNLAIGSKQGSTTQSPPPKTGTISGFSFNDNNKNGTFDAGDAKTSGKTIFLDTNNNGKLDTGETSKVSDTGGNFSFTSLAAGTYHLRRVFPSGYTYSTQLIDLVITSAGETFSNQAIGSKPIG